MSPSCQTFLFFLKCPSLEDLVSFSLKLLFSEQATRLTIFSQRTLKCRELIFTEPDIVATPDSCFENQITAVLPKNRFHATEFKQKLDKMGLRVLNVDAASPHTLQECLQYTAISKMAPQWNTVQHLLVQGRDFLTTSSPLRAIYFDVMVNGNEITLCVKPTCVRIPPFRIENYVNTQIKPEMAESFVIDEKCHVLPSLKVGKAVSVSKRISVTNSTLKNYADLKKYWKNMYGYRLPDIPEEDVWYVNIAFNVRWTPLTYPYFCVRPYGMTQVPRIDPQPTLQSFIADFCKKVGSICTEKCQILDLRASFPMLRMYPAAEVDENATPKIGTTYTMINEKPYRKAVARRPDSENSTKYGVTQWEKIQNDSKSLKLGGHNTQNTVSKSPPVLNASNGSHCTPPSLNSLKNLKHGEHSTQNTVSKSSPALNALNGSHCTATSFKSNGTGMQLASPMNDGNSRQWSDSSSRDRMSEGIQYKLLQKENLENDRERYFKKLITQDLSFLSKDFNSLQLRVTNGNAQSATEVGNITNCLPKYVPNFTPRKQVIQNASPKNKVVDIVKSEQRCVPNFKLLCKQNSPRACPNDKINVDANAKPRYVPHFQPRKQNVLTLPEMFSKVKASNKRKLNPKDDPSTPNVVTGDMPRNPSKKMKGGKANSSSGVQKKKTKQTR